MSIIDDESVSNTSGNEHFQDIMDEPLSRRGFLAGSFATAAAVLLGSVEMLGKAAPAAARDLGEELFEDMDDLIPTQEEGNYYVDWR